MEAAEILLVAAVLAGMWVQATIGFGFAFFAAPAAFAALPPERAVTLLVILSIPIGLLVLYGERRTASYAGRAVAYLVVGAVPGMLVGLWVLGAVDHEALQIAVGVVVLAGAAVQIRAAAAARTAPVEREASGIELGIGVVAGVLTTSVAVNGPPLVLALTRLGLRGGRLRDSLAAVLVPIAILALPLVIVLAPGAPIDALPRGWATAACFPALLIGHRLGAHTFGRLTPSSHHRIVLTAAALAGTLSILTAIV
jgi:uncharacterized membrane protein YfcA